MKSTKISLPNTDTGQEFQVDIRDFQISISVQSHKRLVTDPGKKTEKALDLNTYAHDTVPVNLSLEIPPAQLAAMPNATPEQLEKARADHRKSLESHPFWAPVMAAIEDYLRKQFNPLA